MPLRERESAKQELTTQIKGDEITNSGYERSEYATNKSSSDSFSDQEKGPGRAEGRYEGTARRFSVPFIVRQYPIQVHVREESGRLVKEML